MAEYPPTPFQADITPGAQAWNPTGAIPWGEVPKEKLNDVTIVGYVVDKFKVDSPRWSNGKQWTILQVDVTPVFDVPPTTEPDPNKITLVTLGFEDGHSEEFIPK